MQTNMNTDSITITTKSVNDADGEGMDKSEKIDETDEQLEEQSSLMKVEDSDVSFDNDEDIILSIAGGEERKNTDYKPVDVVESTDKKDKKKRKKKKVYLYTNIGPTVLLAKVIGVIELIVLKFICQNIRKLRIKHSIMYDALFSENKYISLKKGLIVYTLHNIERNIRCNDFIYMTFGIEL